MIARKFYVPCKNAGRWNLYPVGDVQFGADGFNEALWKELVYKIKHDPFALVIGMGDYTDWWRPTVQNKIKQALAGDKEALCSIDEMHRKHSHDVMNMLAPIIKTGRCLGLHEGHHFYEYTPGVTSTQEMCARFNVPYLGRMALTWVIFRGLETGHGNTWSVKIHSQHGEGGASLPWTDMAEVGRKTMPFWDADLFLRGHSTKCYVGSVGYMKMKETVGLELEIVEDAKWIVNTGGFMKGYINGTETYVSKKNLPPAHLNYATVHFDLKRPNVGGRYVKISVTQ